jgi:hypothetical protein
VSALRLVADDPAVFERTGHAVDDSRQIPDPPLQLTCRRCGAVLAKAGDTAGGPLFTSTWLREPGLGHAIFVGDRRLSRSQTIRHRERDLAQRSGKPLHAPARHGVVALLALPVGMASDYPDLLVRCDKHGDTRGHGDTVLDRAAVLGWLRDATAGGPAKRKVALTQPFSEYAVPADVPGTPGPTREQHEVYRPKFDTMPIAEYERRRGQRFERWRQRHGGS